MTVLRLSGRTTASDARLAPKHRQAILLTAAIAIAVLVADSVILLFPPGSGAEHRSAARVSLHRYGATAGHSARVALPRPTLAPRPTPSSRAYASPHAAQRRDPLGSAAASYLASRSGSVLGAVYDVRTGQVWTLGRGGPQDEASIVKVDILETLLAQHRANGTALSASEVTLAQEMIEDSDNDAATTLWDEVGGAHGIGAYNGSVGLTHTTPSGCVACAGFAWPGWGLSTTTASDQIALLRQLLERNSRLTQARQTFALGLMEGVTPSQRWGVADGVSLTATVALKNGWLPLTSAGDWQINSIGWVAGDGRDYLIAVLTTGDPTEQYGIDTIDALSAIVWRAMR